MYVKAVPRAMTKLSGRCERSVVRWSADPIGEIVLLLVAAEVLERQDIDEAGERASIAFAKSADSGLKEIGRLEQEGTAPALRSTRASRRS